MMKIAVIGAGNVGGALAKRLVKAGHTIYLGVRDQKDSKVKALLSPQISAHLISDAVKKADVVITAAYSTGTREIAKQMGDVSKKVIIDAMNTFRGKPKPYRTTAEALLAWTNCRDVVRCFNATGSQNMEDPNYHGTKIDMFVAGDSEKGKRIATKLAKDVGFGEVYDLGGNEAFELAEQLVTIWVTLTSKYGRNIGLKILKR